MHLDCPTKLGKSLTPLSTRFETASITKLFTAVAVLQLIDAGKISFQDPVTGIIDLNNTRIPDQVNIYHLLTHTSGIGDDADEEAGESYEAIWKTKPNYVVRETVESARSIQPKNFFIL